MSRPCFAWAAAALLCAAAHAAEIEAVAFDRDGKPLPNVVVSVMPASGAAPPSAPRVEVVNQKGWEFSPYVTAVRAGSKVEFPNLDRTTHHVKSFSPVKEFEFFLAPDKAVSPTVTFDRAGPVVVYCTLHDWMRTYVYVVDTPWFAKTTETLPARIADLPAGSYKVSAWHPDLGQVGTPLVQSVSVKDGATQVRFDFMLTPRKPRMPKTLPQAGVRF